MGCGAAGLHDLIAQHLDARGQKTGRTERQVSWIQKYYGHADIPQQPDSY